jgi:hypothetical protein
MAIRFDASTDKLTRTTNLPAITTFTIMGWFKISVNLANYGCFIRFGQTAVNAEYACMVNGSGLTLDLFNSGAEVTGSALTVGAWAHLAITVAGTGAGQFLCYLNGVLNITASGDNLPVAQEINLGNNTGGEYINGCVANVQVYGAVLTASEILGEMRCYLPRRTANLLVWSPLMATTDAANYAVAAAAAWTSGGTLATEPGPPIPWSLRPVFVEFRQPVSAGLTVPARPFVIPRQAVANALL